MGDDDRATRPPWWESELGRVERELREHVRRRLPGLGAHHDDLVNESLLGLAARVRGSPEAFPPAWFTREGPADEGERAYLSRLGAAILRRRTADLFRARAAEWAAARTEDAADAVAAEGPDADAPRRALLARMLEVCVGVIAELGDEDRDLVALVAGLEGDRERALTPRERQRLHRVRARLADAIRARLGAAVGELLRDDE